MIKMDDNIDADANADVCMLVLVLMHWQLGRYLESKGDRLSVRNWISSQLKAGWLGVYMYKCCMYISVFYMRFPVPEHQN